jgi:hypothetical protein
MAGEHQSWPAIPGLMDGSPLRSRDLARLARAETRRERARGLARHVLCPMMEWSVIRKEVLLSHDARRALLVLPLCLALCACGGRSGPFAEFLGDGGSAADAAADALVGDAPARDAPRPSDGGLVQSDGAPPASDAAPPPTGVIPCGTQSCNATSQDCCSARNGTSCINKGSQCSGTLVACAGPQDCQTSAPVCCIAIGATTGSVTCTTRRACQGAVACRENADCSGGQQCCGTGTVRGVPVVFCDDPASCGS